MKDQIEEKVIEEMAFDLFLIDRCKHLPQEECHNTTCAHCEAEALYNAGYRKQEWISIDDRLPDECKNVLCFDGSKTIIAFMEKTEDCGEYVPVFWDFVAYDRDDTYDEVCATHWMPLPEPPKMTGGE